MAIRTAKLARRRSLWIVLAGILANPSLGQDQQPGGRLPTQRVNPTGATVVAPGSGDEAPIAVWLGHARSDNAARTSGSGRGSYNALGTRFGLGRDRGRLAASLVGALEYRAYEDDIAEDERVGGIAANAEVGIVPERFSWRIGESYVQGRSDPFGADTVENRENVNVFETGPSINVGFGGRTSLGVATTYSDRNYGRSTFLDSELLETELGLFRQIRPTTLIGIEATVTDVEYESTMMGYDIEAAYLSYERSLASGAVDLAVGTNKLITELRTVREPYFELSWERTLAARSTLTLSGVSGFTDSGRLLELRPDQVAIDVLLTSEATNRQQIALDYELDLPRTRVNVGAAVLQDEFEQNTALDSDGDEVHVGITRSLTRLSNLGLDLHKVTRDFTVTGVDNEENFARLWFSRRFGQRLLMETHVQRSENPDIYTERLYQVTLIWEFGRSGAGAGRGRGFDARN
jgi:hypothetical protein